MRQKVDGLKNFYQKLIDPDELIFAIFTDVVEWLTINQMRAEQKRQQLNCVRICLTRFNCLRSYCCWEYFSQVDTDTGGWWVMGQSEILIKLS